MSSITWTRTFLVAAVAALAGCAGVAASQSAGSVPLGAGGHAEGRVTVAGGGKSNVGLSVRGSGQVTFSVRDANGSVLEQGTLGRSDTSVNPPKKTTLTVTLDARADTAAVVEYTIRGPETDVTWDLSRASGPPPAEPKK